MAFSLNDYEILDVIGNGGFGTVYRARQKSLGRIVAVKCLSASRTQDRNELIRFRREAQAMAALAHDSAIAVFDYAYASGSYYIVMEYIDGFSYEEAVRKRIGRELALYVMERVASALRFAHEKSIIHRDIKPANILLGRSGQVKLADFGLALFQREMTSQSTAAALGTLAYMAPEVMVNPSEVDYRADIFSLGCILYEALGGAPPFAGSTIAEISYKVLNCEPAGLPSDPKLAHVSGLALQCLSKERENRPDLEHISSALRTALGDSYSSAPDQLASFVRGEQPATDIRRAVQVPEPHGPELEERVRARRQVALVAFACAAVVSIAAGLFFFQTRSGRGAATTLPALSILDDPEHSELPGNNERGTAVGTREDGPRPLTGDLGETRTGSLVLRGLRPGDSLTVNGLYAPMPAGTREHKLPVASGFYRIELHRRQKLLCTKEVEVRPYQVIEWDVRQNTGNRQGKRK